MYENTTTLTFCTGRLDEAVKTLNDDIVPILRGQPGLLSLALITRAAENQVTILSIWKSMAHAWAIESNPRYCQAYHRLDGLLESQDARGRTPIPLN